MGKEEMKKDKEWDKKNIHGIDVSGIFYNEAITLAQREIGLFYFIV